MDAFGKMDGGVRCEPVAYGLCAYQFVVGQGGRDEVVQVVGDGRRVHAVECLRHHRFDVNANRRLQ